MFYKRLAKLGKSVLPLAMATLMVAGAAVAARVDNRRRGDVVVEFEWCLARSRQNMRTGIRRCFLGTRRG